MRSKNLKDWESIKLFELEGIDIREARLSITPNGEILVNIGAGVWKDNNYISFDSFISISDKNGENFSSLKKAQIDPTIEQENKFNWIWRVTWNKNIGYAILYQVEPDRKKEWKIYLVKTSDGLKYDLVKQLSIQNKPNESTIRFDKNGKMYILIRREAGDKSSILVTSNYPYKEFDYETLDYFLGGPNFLFFNKNELLIGTRFAKEENNKRSIITALLLTDLKGKVQQTIELPSNGDSSYPGMLIEKNTLYFLYYSSHEGKSSIYLALIPLNIFK